MITANGATRDAKGKNAPRIAQGAALLWLSCMSNAAWSAEPAQAQPQRPASVDAMPAVATPPPTPAASSSKSTTGAAKPNTRAASDRLNLDTTIVTGNRELPKVLYIVPWKRADMGDLPPQPFNSLLDEVLTPVDRDVFRREVTYYGAMTEKEAAAPATAAGSEK
jgi:hypothetical protein